MDRRALAVRAGLAAPPIALGAIVLAMVLDPGFSLVEGALSDTGEIPPGRDVSLDLVADRPSVLVFNGGLLTAGVVALPFAWLLHEDGEHPLERWGAVCFGLALVSMAGVGLFPLPHGYHAPVAIVHFLATIAFFLVYGVGLFQRGATDVGFATTALGVVTFGSWLGWTLVVDGAGIAVPELVGAFALGGWTFLAAFDRFTEEQYGPSEAPGGSIQ